MMAVPVGGSEWQNEARHLEEVLRGIPGNDGCFDCENSLAEWASVNLGILLCVECAGVHRGLGVGVSFVRSVTMDAWNQEQIELMKHGGGEKLRQCLIDSHLMMSSPKLRYFSPAAELYRQQLRARARGDPEPQALPDAEVALLNEQMQDVADREAKRSSEGTVAEWTPDGHGKCQICAVKFTVVRRRHHCRKCGKLVCGKCAPKDNTKPIPKQGHLDPVRHCKECYRSPACFKNQQRIGTL
eukprot:TRINITY_DN7409_c0_g1_i4.p1 TRINITY_DN7409_c0_g1~~TRINITY_DN7409_c0_g1_i4.p1  ORF type:complete len:242 (+),score=36.15 TRINITY_DN7409_c0_g1_i4:33-758(+)